MRAQKGLKPQAIYDRLRLDDSSFWSVRGAWQKWHKERGVRAEDVASAVLDRLPRRIGRRHAFWTFLIEGWRGRGLLAA